MASLPSHRASDFDREQVAERLRHATAEGRLNADELEERLQALYASRTYGELDSLVEDLPVSSPQAAVGGRIPPWASAAGAATLLLTLLGMLGGAARHSGAAARHPGHPGSGPFADPHHGFVMATSMLGVFALLVVSAALFWLFMRSRLRYDSRSARYSQSRLNL